MGPVGAPPGLVTALPEIRPVRVRRPTSTAAFGSSRRESHDASGFYRRFVAPEVSSDETVARPKRVDVLYRRDARDMGNVESNSIALVVTSPPYFAGKEYEESLGQNGVPGSYFEYLTLLKDVFAECKRVLEPGGRIAVNVANLGRRPYRSLAGDVVEILQDLGLLLRGEVVWWKGRAAGGSCAWGTFQRPSNPVLRDITERIVVASKGRFDRAIRPEKRLELELPSTSTISRDEFLEATTDLWEIPPESATRVGHPAPFPVELPRRLIDLFTYEGDVVLDPFMGSGTTAVAAVQERPPLHRLRHRCRLRGPGQGAGDERNGCPVARRSRSRRRCSPGPCLRRRGRGAGALLEGCAVASRPRSWPGCCLDTCGFVDIRSDVKLPGSGSRSTRGHRRDRRGVGLRRLGGLHVEPRRLEAGRDPWRALGRATVLHQARPELPSSC